MASAVKNGEPVQGPFDNLQASIQRGSSDQRWCRPPSKGTSGGDGGAGGAAVAASGLPCCPIAAQTIATPAAQGFNILHTGEECQQLYLMPAVCVPAQCLGPGRHGSPSYAAPRALRGIEHTTPIKLGKLHPPYPCRWLCYMLAYIQ